MTFSPKPIRFMMMYISTNKMAIFSKFVDNLKVSYEFEYFHSFKDVAFSIQFSRETNKLKLTKFGKKKFQKPKAEHILFDKNLNQN